MQVGDELGGAFGSKLDRLAAIIRLDDGGEGRASGGEYSVARDVRLEMRRPEDAGVDDQRRSEERRVGKECRL